MARGECITDRPPENEFWGRQTDKPEPIPLLNVLRNVASDADYLAAEVECSN